MELQIEVKTGACTYSSSSLELCFPIDINTNQKTIEHHHCQEDAVFNLIEVVVVWIWYNKEIHILWCGSKN